MQQAKRGMFESMGGLLAAIILILALLAVYFIVYKNMGQSGGSIAKNISDSLSGIG